MRLTRRHVRAAVAGAATTAVYLAGGRLADSKAFRGSSLLVVAVAGLAYAEHASAVANKQRKRLDAHIAATAAAVHFVSSGGSVGGPITASGLITANGGIQTNGAAINTSGGNLSMGAGDITCDSITSTGTITSAHILMSGGNINMGGNNCNTGSAYVVSGAPHRANLGTVTFNAAGLQSVADRADFILNTAGTGAGWAS